MKKTKLVRTFLAATSAVALAAVVYGCGGGGGGPRVEPQPPAAVDFTGVAAGYRVEAGTYEIAAGETLTVGDVTFSCAEGGAGCTLTVAGDGTATYAGDGGQVTAANSAAYLAKLTAADQRKAANDAIEAAKAAVAALSAGSTDADVSAAEALLAAAKTAVGGSTALPAAERAALSGQIGLVELNLARAKTGIADYRAHQGQLDAADNAIAAAQAAVDALTAGSGDDAVAAAEGLLGTARAAVAAGALLTASEVAALSGRIAAVEASLATAKARIADDRTHRVQLGAAEDAVAAAQAAVAALTSGSTDAEVGAAERAVEAAQAAVAAGTLLTAGEVEELNDAIATAEGSLGTAKTAIADMRIHDRQLGEVNEAVGAAETAVGGLTERSTDASIAAAQALIDAAETALSDGTMLTDEETSAAQARIAASMVALERVTVEAKLHAADSAIDGLSVVSTDAEVAAAQAALSAASAALRKVKLLSGPQVNAYHAQIDAARASLAAKRTQISDIRTHGQQLAVLNRAVSDARAAVLALNRMSSDAELSAARAAVEAAAAALAAGTKLTAGEKTAASATIDAAGAALEYVTVEAGVYGAETAVDGLTVASTDADVAAAQAAIEAASAALLERINLLTSRQAIAFQDSIDAARTSLAAKKAQIADSRAHDTQLGALNGAVSAAQAAVAALGSMPTDAAIAGAQAAIEAAEAALAAGTKLTAEEKSAASAAIGASRTTLETVSVQARVTAAQTAVAGLTVASPDADVAAAQAAIDAASAALNEATALTAQQALAFRDSIDAAEGALEAAKTKIADSRTHGRQLEAVAEAVEAARTAVAALSADSTDADADGAATKIQAAKDAVAAATALTAGETAAATQTIAAAETALVVQRAAIKARRDDAKAMFAALTGTLGTFDPADAAHAADGGEVSGTGDYERSAADTAPAVAGWAGSVWEAAIRDTGGEVTQTDTVVVYTDREAPRSASYATYFPRGAVSDAHLDPSDSSYVKPSAGFEWRRWVGVASVSGDGTGVITLAETEISSTDTSRLFDAAALPARGVSQSYLDGDDTTAGLQVEFPGSFQGVAGTFRCEASGSGAACTAQMSVGGALTFGVVSDDGNDAWTFTPTGTNASVAGAQEDADYLDFGYWVEHDLTEATDPYTVDGFFAGKAPHNTLTSVEGSARYSGKAAGLYARLVYEGSTLKDDRTGRFTADVVLQAHFGGSAIAEVDRNSIGGTISNFMDGGQPVDSGWTVRLNRIQSGAAGQTWDGSDAGSFSGGTTSGGGAAGTWSGRFYGDDTQVNGVTPQPSGAAGEFTAGFVNGSVVGAFGARKQ